MHLRFQKAGDYREDEMKDYCDLACAYVHVRRERKSMVKLPLSYG